MTFQTAEAEGQCRKALVLLCGLPGSGKTTLSGTLEGLWKRQDVECTTVVSVDQLQDTDSFTPESWHRAREKAYALVDVALRERTCGRRLVVVDDTMFYRSMRRKYYLLAESHASPFQVVYVRCPVEVCLARNAQRQNAKVPEDIVRKAAVQFELPDPVRHYWEGRTHVFESEQTDPRDEMACSELAKALLGNWESPQKLGVDSHLKAEQKARGAETNAGMLHCLDLRLRVLISNRMKVVKTDGDRKTLEAEAARLNNLRTHCLKALKSNPGNNSEHEDDPVEGIVMSFVQSVEAGDS